MATQRSGRMNVSDRKDSSRRDKMHGRGDADCTVSTNVSDSKDTGDRFKLHGGNTAYMAAGKKPARSGFTPPGAKSADGYRSAGHKRDGVLRNSGHSGAHRIGRK